MPKYDSNIREEELKNKVATDYFFDFDCTRIVGNIDFCVAVSNKQPALFEAESLLWAEAKTGVVKDLNTSFVQLILTIGKARTFDNLLPPPFLCAFDSQRIAFIPYHEIVDIFYINDFNWNVTPSNHESCEFKRLYQKVVEILENRSLIYQFGDDDVELRSFIRTNLRSGRDDVNRMSINKNNFISVYAKWRNIVMPTIGVDWVEAKKAGILEADFYLADLLSHENIYIKEKLRVLLRGNHYKLHQSTDSLGELFRNYEFSDSQKAHTQFWQRYKRPPKKDYWNYIVERRDLLVPQDVRERKGSYFTPQIWVEKSQEYIADVLGENWQDEYTVWDCAAGTGNLLNGLANKYNIWASTLDQADVDVMKDRVKNGANLLENHIFQFDFLNDDFAILPQALLNIVKDPEKRKKLIIYINPPYGEAGSTYSKNAKKGVSNQTKVHTDYCTSIGKFAKRELFVQFFMRIYQEIPGAVLAEFSKLKILQAPYFADFRNVFRAKLLKMFIVPATTFDNVKGRFPIGFLVWDTSIKEIFSEIVSDVFDANGNELPQKSMSSYANVLFLNDWLRATWKKPAEFGYLACNGNDFQHRNEINIQSKKGNETSTFYKPINTDNIVKSCIYLSVRHCIEATWLNDRDQFLYPNDGWKTDSEFQNDCLAFTLFHGQNRISSLLGINHWIPFTEAEVDAKERFSSHFMSDFIRGKLNCRQTEQQIDIFETKPAVTPIPAEPLCFSPVAQTVMEAGRALWRYYHAQPNAIADASFYDIKLHFQGRNAQGKMNSDSDDATYTELIGTLRKNLKLLAKQIEPKVYEYGFLKR